MGEKKYHQTFVGREKVKENSKKTQAEYHMIRYTMQETKNK
jgi:hypothetical protein